MVLKINKLMLDKEDTSFGFGLHLKIVQLTRLLD